MTIRNNTLLNLSSFRKNLKSFFKPEILSKLAEFIEATGDDNSMLDRYDWFANNSEDGENCRYAQMAKNFFLQNQAESVAKTVNWLYHNWSKFYE